ncbi:MAG: hypothetical protein JO308_05705 [Verrucomicrobia bacterium]|nr:hypothetical protein [Verrucomicrobiota bacterium]
MRYYFVPLLFWFLSLFAPSALSDELGSDLLITSPPPPLSPELVARQNVLRTGTTEVVTQQMKIFVNNGIITKVLLSGGNPLGSQGTINWIKQNWQFRAGVTRTFNQSISYVLRGSHPQQEFKLDPSQPLYVVVVIKEGAVTSVTQVSGDPKLGTVAADFVRNNWRFAPKTFGVYKLPVTFKTNSQPLLTE